MADQLYCDRNVKLIIWDCLFTYILDWTGLEQPTRTPLLYVSSHINVNSTSFNLFPIYIGTMTRNELKEPLIAYIRFNENKTAFKLNPRIQCFCFLILSGPAGMNLVLNPFSLEIPLIVFIALLFIYWFHFMYNPQSIHVPPFDSRIIILIALSEGSSSTSTLSQPLHYFLLSLVFTAPTTRRVEPHK